MEDFGGNDTLIYEGLETNDSRENPLAVVGGTGKYAGADGTATVRELSINERTLTAYERITVTFTP